MTVPLLVSPLLRGMGGGGEATSNPLSLNVTVAICVSIVGTFPRLDAASSAAAAANPFEF
jgi:hypothetical protein